MPYKNLAQLQALSKSVGIRVRIEERPYPVYQGKLTSIDAEGLARHAAEVQEWQSVLMNQIRKIGDDLGEQLTQIQATPPVVNCATLPGLKGDKGDSVKGDRGADADSGTIVLFDHYDDIPYTEAPNLQIMWADDVPPNTLTKDGDKILGTYVFNVAPTASGKYVIIYFRGVTIALAFFDDSFSGPVRMDFIVVRTSNTTAKGFATSSAGVLTDSDTVSPQPIDLTGMDFTGLTDIWFEIVGGGSNGDVTGKFATIWKVSAA